MLRSVLAPFLAAAALAACDTPCDTARKCALDPTGRVCDGTAFLTCDAASAGSRVVCAPPTRQAVCTSTGWTYESP